MKIDAMMAEIRETHPNADDYRRMNDPGEWVVATYDGTGAVLATAMTRFRAVDLALRAVRKARPKPMKVVKTKHPDAICSSCLTGFNVWSDDSCDMKVIGNGKTPLQAWKAAAAAIQASEDKS